MQYYNRILTTIEKIKIGESYKDSPMGIGSIMDTICGSGTVAAGGVVTAL